MKKKKKNKNKKNKKNKKKKDMNHITVLMYSLANMLDL